MDAKMFGAFLAQVRRVQGLTQAELAEQLHVTDKAVSRWERGVGLPDINTLEPLADALGLSLADLMHCHDPGQGAPAAPVPLEDFFSMLRRQHTVDWHSVRVAMLCLSIALALWGMLTCPGSIAVHWHALNDGSLQSDGCPRGSFFRFWPEWNFSCWNSGTTLNRAVSITVTLKRAPFWMHRFYA